MYKARFKNIDYPKHYDFESYFKTKRKAIKFIEELAKEHKVKANWKGRDYFSEVSSNPDYNNATWHGCIDKIEVE